MMPPAAEIDGASRAEARAREAKMRSDMQRVSRAYDTLLARVTAGEITKADPFEVLASIDDAWSNDAAAAQLATLLLDYAREQTNGTSESRPARERARRLRLYAIVQQVYERVRLAPHPPVARA